jgi:sorting nexin-4
VSSPLAGAALCTRGQSFTPSSTALTASTFASDPPPPLSTSLQRFLTRLTLHPVLRRAQLLIYFLTATTDWAVKKHKHLAATTTPAGSILDTIGDSLVHLTQGTKVRKVDERFEAMREEVDRFEFGLAGLERGTGRLKGRTNGQSPHAAPAVRISLVSALKPTDSDGLQISGTTTRTSHARCASSACSRAA